MEKQLKEVITKAFELGSTWTIDWSKATLPILELRKKEKKRALEKEKDFTSNKKAKSIRKSFNSFTLDEKDEKREQRLKRFENDRSANTNNTNLPSSHSDPTKPVVGYSTTLEKKYLRLTSEPDPASVRPLPVLKQTLELLKKKWKQEQDYSYICDQFKSMRQDLTVQHIQNDFTVLVYEIHARIALERSDLGEYNQCQTQLKVLYSKGIPGHSQEFLAYRILYLLHTSNYSDLSDITLEIEEQKERGPLDPAISHALKVYKAMTTNNYHRFFKLYVDAPNMGGYLMDSFVHRERLAALSRMCFGMRQTIDLKFLIKELGFADMDEVMDFMKSCDVEKFLKHSEQKDGNTKVSLQTKPAYSTVEQLRQKAFAKIDIKGQII